MDFHRVGGETIGEFDVVLDKGLGSNFKVLTSIKVWVSFLLFPFPRYPLRFKHSVRKLGLFSPLHVPVTSSQWFVGWVCLMVYLGMCNVLMFNVNTFMYLKSWKWQLMCGWSYVQVWTSLWIWQGPRLDAQNFVWL